MLPQRWQQNKKRNLIFTGPLKACIRVMRSGLISEEDMRYYWLAWIEIVHELETANRLRAEAKDNPNMKILSDLSTTSLRKTIITIPEAPLHDLKAAELLARAKSMMRYGAMRDG